MNRLRLPTPGTRLSAWAFPALTMYIGICYLLMPDLRFSSAAFDVAKAIMPMRLWGAVFIVVAVVKLTAISVGSPRLFVGAMCAATGLYAGWSVFFLASLGDPHVSFVAPAWPAFVAACHVFTLATVAPRTR